MKIGILHPFQFRFRRGIERYTWAMVGEFTRHGIHTDLLTWHWPDPIGWGEVPPGSKIYQVPDFRYYRHLTAFPYYLFRGLANKYDWIICNFADYGEAEALHWLRKFRQQRFIIVLHFPANLVPHRYRSFTRYNLHQQADYIIGVSRSVSQQAESFFNRPCVTIENGIQTDRFTPSRELRLASRQNLGIEPDTPLIITLAALEERKGIQYVIQALPALREKFPDIQYWIAGEGEYRHTLTQLIHDSGVEKHVRLLGRQDNVIPYLAAADIGCLLSYGEAFGLVILEYMAMELPVIASYRQPFVDLIQPEWGKLVNEQDSNEITDTLITLLTDKHRCRQMGQTGRRKVQEYYNWNRVASEYLQILMKD